jgi:hypothetical protein
MTYATTCMILGDITLNERQSQKDKYSIFHLCEVEKSNIKKEADWGFQFWRCGD